MTVVGEKWGTRFGFSPAATLFLKVKSATIVCRYHPMFRSRGVRSDVFTLVNLCPNVERLEMRVFDGAAKEEFEKLVEHGMERKPASIFEVMLVARKSGIWGDE